MSTFFRHFPDKRELLVARQESLSRLLADGITDAPASATPLEAVAAGLERASSAMGPMNRELGVMPGGPAPIARTTASSPTHALDALQELRAATTELG